MPLLDALLLDPAPFTVWISYRTDGIKGSGTANDPFNGSTQGLFDARMAELAGNTCVHIGPSPSSAKPFETNGSSAWSAKPGLRIIGAGIDITFLQLVNPTAGLNFAVAHPLDSDHAADAFEIAALTIDCNLAAAGSTSSCGAVRVMGNNARIHRVKAINWGANASGPACYVFSIIAGAPDGGVPEVVNAGIEECIAIQPAALTGASVTAFNVGGQDDLSFTKESQAKSPYIRNCFADFEVASPSASNPKSRGISMCWCRGGVVENNHIYNADVGGPYQDNHSIRDLIVRNNFHKNVAVGVSMPLGTLIAFALTDLRQNPTSSRTARAIVDGVHGLAVGDRVQVSPDSGLPAVFGGIFMVTATPDDTTFEYLLPSNPGNAGASAGDGARILGIGRAIIEGNVIELVPGVDGVAAISVKDANDGSSFSEEPDFVHGDLIIRNNKIRYVDAVPSADLDATLVEVQGGKNVIVQNNIVDTIATRPLKNERCANLTYFNNRTPSGKLLLGYEPKEKTVYGELETDAEDAFVLAFLEKR